MKLQELSEHFDNVDINELPFKKQLTAILEDPDLIQDLYNPSEKLQLAIVKAQPMLITFFDSPCNAAVTAALTNEDWIIDEYFEGLYDTFVKEYFANNSLLMNKWLRYAKNVREQS